MKKYFYILTINLLIFLFHVDLHGQSNFNLKVSFDQPNSDYEKTGRGLCKIEDSILKTKEAYASFGDQSWTNYEVTFSARTPIAEKEVWIWAGFRASDRDDRYILGLRGGSENDLTLARLGYMGADEFLAIRHLDFKLQPGKWYDIKVQVSGNRFAYSCIYKLK